MLKSVFNVSHYVRPGHLVVVVLLLSFFLFLPYHQYKIKLMIS